MCQRSRLSFTQKWYEKFVYSFGAKICTNVITEQDNFPLMQTINFLLNYFFLLKIEELGKKRILRAHVNRMVLFIKRLWR